MQIFDSLKSAAFGSRRVIPSLDGLRAISICFVLLAHCIGTAGFLDIHDLEQFGIFGVRVFFVISGYLITTILLKELTRTGDINLPKFYFARGLRLFPACYFLIAVMALLAHGGYLYLGRPDILHAITYTTNYSTRPAWHLGHLWSLAVEEQFYLVWPLTLRFLRKERAMKVLYAVILLAPIFRRLAPLTGIAFQFLTVSDALAIGCILAAHGPELRRHPRYQRVINFKAFYLVPLLAIAINFVPYFTFNALAGATLMNIAIALTVDWSVQNKDSAAGKFLNLPSVSFFGVLSYSLYLWQQPFLNRYSHALIASFPLNVLLSVLVALLSYICIETPFMKLRHYLEPKLFEVRPTYAAGRHGEAVSNL